MSGGIPAQSSTSIVKSRPFRTSDVQNSWAGSSSAAPMAPTTKLTISAVPWSPPGDTSPPAA